MKELLASSTGCSNLEVVSPIHTTWKKLNKLKISNSSQNHQRTEVIGQIAVPQTRETGNTENHNTAEQNPWNKKTPVPRVGKLNLQLTNHWGISVDMHKNKNVLEEKKKCPGGPSLRRVPILSWDIEHYYVVTVRIREKSLPAVCRRKGNTDILKYDLSIS